MRVALAQLNFKIGDLEGNLARIEDTVRRARGEAVDLVVFSELALSGYPPRDFLERDVFIDTQLECLERVAALTDDELGVVLGFIDRNDAPQGKRLLNGAALCHRGEIVGRVHKRLLPSYDVFDEDRYFEPTGDVACLEFRGTRLGLSICEDAWNDSDFWEAGLYHVDPMRELADDGAEFFINISASPFAIGKEHFRRELLAEHAANHGIPLVSVNQVGANDELVFDGHSLAIDASGAIVARLNGFHEDFRIIEPFGSNAAVEVEPEAPARQACEALVLGLRDYVHKSGFHSALVGLSGGIDSAVTAAIAARALGPENVWGVAMPSRYSSEHSVADARLLARNLGIRFDVVSIEPIHASFLEQLDFLFSETEPGIAEENIQARTRGTLLMAMSNKFGPLVLATGNKSEMSVGYATLYGDMCGALAVIADVSKLLVYDVARHLNQEAGRELIPQNTLEKPPSAELRPGQIDEDSLPPYEILDGILEGYVVHGLTRDEIIARGYEPPVVDRIIALTHRAEYKRNQAPPILKITDKAFGVGWRYPLVASYEHTA